jgi:multidrug efflux pump subunit AcrB
MSLAQIAIEKKYVTYFVVGLLVFAGTGAFFTLGQLEDPEFTVKTAVVVTQYPGASPQEVELEVTDRIEKAIQEMPEVYNMYSISRAGLSIVKVDIKQEYWADRLPQVWDVMRSKIRDITPTLPPGAGKPDIGDDFSFVFGFVLAVTGDGFSYAELEDYTKFLRKELSLVEGVSRVELWGVQHKVIYLDVSERQIAQLGITKESMLMTLASQNMVVDAGAVEIQDKRFRVEPTGSFKSPEEIGDLSIRTSLLDTLLNLTEGAPGKTSELIRVSDLAEVRRGYLEPPFSIMRFNGRPALAISLANVAGGNIVHTGRNIDKRLAELIPQLPVGIEVSRIAWQSDLVDESIKSFLINLLEAVAIVLIVLTVPMGWRMGVIIGFGLLLTILGTFICMSIFGIDLQRMSLGALVIALGMMVDNAIVVADGFVVRLQQGMDRKQAAIEAASQPSWPLLGATIVAVMAFYPIFASVADAGEYCRTLFTVVGISLLLSWLLAMTVTPLQCLALLPDPKPGEAEEEAYGGKLYDGFRKLLATAIRARVPTIGVMVGLLAASAFGFGHVEQMFFPDSSRKQFMLDYWAPEGTRIQQVSADLVVIEEKLLEDPRVESLSTFTGTGPPRFYLPVDPELPYQSYAQLIVNTHTLKGVRSLVAELEPWLKENAPQALVRVRQYGVGVSENWKFEARFSGPAVADLAVLRALGEEGMAILEKSSFAKDIRTDMRQRVRKVVPEYHQERGRWAGVTRLDIAEATKRSFDGFTAGLYREGDDLHPIIVRYTEDARVRVAGAMETIQITPALANKTVPLEQVTQEIRTEWEDPIIIRYNRRRAVTIQASPNGVTFPTLLADVLDELNAIPLPPGYKLEWDGEQKSTEDAQNSLIPGLIPSGVVIVLIIVVLFNAYRPPLIILITIPFAAIGITLGLLVTRAPFGFVALLGAMSLAGMMIKNSIVLLDQINIELAAGKSTYQAVMDSAVSRLRPVVLAAATTVLGVIPLLQDVFWVSMAVTIMAGLAFGTVLTMVLVPVFYCTLYQVKSPESAN